MSELKGNVKHHGGCYAYLCVVASWKVSDLFLMPLK